MVGINIRENKIIIENIWFASDSQFQIVKAL